ncbi:hypothetical protein ACVWZX_004846 [Deinococcus sp. UYEF24]
MSDSSFHSALQEPSDPTRPPSFLMTIPTTAASLSTVVTNGVKTERMVAVQEVSVGHRVTVD